MKIDSILGINKTAYYVDISILVNHETNLGKSIFHVYLPHLKRAIETEDSKAVKNVQQNIDKLIDLLLDLRFNEKLLLEGDSQNG